MKTFSNLIHPHYLLQNLSALAPFLLYSSALPVSQIPHWKQACNLYNPPSSKFPYLHLSPHLHFSLSIIRKIYSVQILSSNPKSRSRLFISTSGTLSEHCHLMKHFKVSAKEPWPVWPRWLGVVLGTEELPVQLHQGTCPSWDSIPSGGHTVGSWWIALI